MQERRYSDYICQVTNCAMPAQLDGYCRSHYWKARRRAQSTRLEVTTNDRQWYAEQGRAFDEQALLARRLPA